MTSFTLTDESTKSIIPETKSLKRFCSPKPIPTNRAAEPATSTDKFKPKSCKPVIIEKTIIKYLTKL